MAAGSTRSASTPAAAASAPAATARDWRRLRCVTKRRSSGAWSAAQQESRDGERRGCPEHEHPLDQTAFQLGEADPHLSAKLADALLELRVQLGPAAGPLGVELRQAPLPFGVERRQAALPF